MDCYICYEEISLNKKAAEAANKKIAKFGKEYATALGMKVFAENDRGIIRSKIATQAIRDAAAAGNKMSESAAERESRASKDYEDACARLSDAETKCAQAYSDLQTAKNDFDMAMASEE